MARINTLERVTLGGATQWLSFRGDVHNPLLLWLHGGPGSADIATAGLCSRALAEHFLVVHWDQRGAGKSRLIKAPLTTELLITDAQELIAWLLNRFRHPKLYLVGHSWGSALGILVSSRSPELIHAFAGVGQLIHGIDNERLSFGTALRLARHANNRRAERHLRRNPPPYRENVAALLAQRAWLLWLGGFFHRRATALPYVLRLLTSRSYTLQDKLLYQSSLNFSLRRLWPEVEQLDLFKSVPRLTMPILFCLGRYDAVTPPALAVRYLEQVQAPEKELVWFERSAHCPYLEEPERFTDTLITHWLSTA